MELISIFKFVNFKRRLIYLSPHSVSGNGGKNHSISFEKKRQCRKYQGLSAMIKH